MQDVNEPIEQETKAKKELIKPLSISLCNTDKNSLIGYGTRINSTLLQRNIHTPKPVNKSDIIRACIHFLNKMDDDELIDFYLKEKL